MATKRLAIFFVVLASLLSVRGLFHAGFPPTHDGEYHLLRFYEFYNTLISGSWYPRWAEDFNFGFGLPLFNYVYPLPNYIAAFFHAFGLQFTDAFKCNLILATFTGAIFLYFFIRDYFGALSGIVASVYFLFSPYRLVDIYVRGSVGEVWAIAIVPGILWGIGRFVATKSKRYQILSACLVSALVFSHNILALLFLPFLLSFFFVVIGSQPAKRKVLFDLTLIIVLGIGLSSIFWLPALFEKKFVTGLEIYDYTKQFPDLFSLLFPSWGTGFAGETGGNAMSTQIGVANLAVVLLGCIYIFRTKLSSARSRLIVFSLMWFFIVFLLMNQATSVVWRYVPLFHFVQFPWRYLSVDVIVCAILAGSLIDVMRKPYLVAAVLIFFSISSTLNYARFAYFHQRDDSYYITRSNFIDGTNSPGNSFNTIYLSSVLKRTSIRASLESQNGTIRTIFTHPELQSYEARVASPSMMLLNTLYFPGWKAEDNGKEIPIVRDKTGLMKLFLIPGRHFIRLRFADTIVRSSAKYISFVSFILLIYLAMRKNKPNHESRD